MARPRAYELIGSYGDFKGSKVYFLGFKVQPKFLPITGRGFGGLKHLLELLKRRFKKFTLTFTPDEDSIRLKGKEYRVRLSVASVRKLQKRRWDANAHMNTQLGKQLLAETFPQEFPEGGLTHSYQRGMFAQIFSDQFDARVLGPEDRTALTQFLTKEMASAASTLDLNAAYKTTKDAQLLYLARLVEEFDRQIAASHDESWWQTYFSKNILLFQDNYIRLIEKLNITVAGTQFPDFIVVTSDGYLDILEIKKPDTVLLKEDASHLNYYWGPEIAKAISQVENYIDRVTKNSSLIRTELKDRYGIDLRIIKPRGIVIAGRASEFGGVVKKADDFRLLNEGLKNVQILPYDEVSQHLRNTITSIERLTKDAPSARTAKKLKGKSK